MSGSTAHPLNEALRKLDLGNAPPEEFDNFYTPENETFYANSSYLPLDTAQPSIRLLRVHPKRRSLEEHLGDNPRWAARHAAIGNRHGSSAQPSRPGGPGGLIACDLVENCLLSRAEGRFYALSYCAGSPTDVAPILIDGIPFNAFFPSGTRHGLRHGLLADGRSGPD
jgi:hypothetical protein